MHGGGILELFISSYFNIPVSFITITHTFNLFLSHSITAIS